jgi:hypothetical protein
MQIAGLALVYRWRTRPDRRARIEPTAPLPWLGAERISGALGDRPGVDIAVIDFPPFLAIVSWGMSITANAVRSG